MVVNLFGTIRVKTEGGYQQNDGDSAALLSEFSSLKAIPRDLFTLPVEKTLTARMLRAPPTGSRAFFSWAAGP